MKTGAHPTIGVQGGAQDAQLFLQVAYPQEAANECPASREAQADALQCLAPGAHFLDALVRVEVLRDAHCLVKDVLHLDGRLVVNGLLLDGHGGQVARGPEAT